VLKPGIHHIGSLKAFLEHDVALRVLLDAHPAGLRI
jgi:hypothetical protein